MRHKYNKRKEAFVKSKRPPKRINKEERDKDVFKRRKFIKNVFEEEPAKSAEEDSSSEEEEAEPGFGQLLKVFGGDTMDKHAIESDSDDDDDEEEEIEGSGNEMDEKDDYDVDDDSEDSNDNDSGEEEKHEDNIVEPEANDNSDDEVEEDAVEEDEDVANSGGSGTDPFFSHFDVDLDSSTLSSLEEKSRWRTTASKLPHLGNIQTTTFDVRPEQGKVKTLMDNEEESALKDHQTKLMSQIPDTSSVRDLHLKQKLQPAESEMSGLEREVLGVLSQYKDLLFTDRTKHNAEQLRKAYTLHALNHMLKTRAKIIRNNTKQEARQEGDEKLRDQGFCRPKVLIVVPFKESCRLIVELLIQLFSPDQAKGSVANRKRFNEDFVKIERVRKDKPDDFYDIFQGDVDDSFKLGICVTKKTLKLYTDFYSSDIIITSPLGLRLVTGVEGEDYKTDTDFLSSIEMLIMDQVDVLMMQNWDHVTSILHQLHLQPRETHGVDYGRIRLWCLDGHSAQYRQNIIISSVPSPEVNSVWNRNCRNYMGKVRVVSESLGHLSSIVSGTSMEWHRVQVESPSQSVEARLKLFTETIMPRFTKDSMFHTAVFVPSYFDYVKVRNWFKSSNLDYCEVNEYSKDKNIAKARDMFYHNEKHFLLYTERSHFYRRFRLKGIRHLIFYQPPSYGWMFSELCNLLQKSFQNPRGGTASNMSITVIYSRYDVQRVGLCVGSETASKMISAKNSRHIFNPGE